MALSKKPVTGMKDILPGEMEIRDYVIRVIKDTYRKFGFTGIETPCLENIENLTNKQGGENEKLIFKVMKRGDKLNLETAQSEADLCDLGLRYDLTVPLVRYYSNNSATLPNPFKALQIGPSFRAERPQRGRYRQFYQCDIDILGDPSNLAEIELITATTTCLGNLGFKGFEIRINDRRILKAMAEYAGFKEESFDEVFIILDKMDKIGLDGVREELLAEGFSAESIDKYAGLFEMIKDKGNDGLKVIAEKIGDFIDGSVKDWLEEIMVSVDAAKEASFEVVFDPTLVRGMGYYTGTIFEIAIPEFGGSCGGGGRYDKMVGKFTGQETPAVGFSIGFERIVMLLLEQGYEIPDAGKKIAFLVEKNMGPERLSDIMKEASALRKSGNVVLVSRMNKNKKFQKEQLSNDGYTEFKEFFVEARD
ncbi:MAG: histidine--tRNA ligase [Lachnospiraceae bacterium]|nr:histidine--tRNA ligase [Lachnospiraceae bacterium]